MIIFTAHIYEYLDGSDDPRDIESGRGPKWRLLETRTACLLAASCLRQGGWKTDTVKMLSVRHGLIRSLQHDTKH
jgi:hypothetical protein